MDAEGSGENNNEYYKKLNQQIVQKDNLIKLLQLQIRNLKTQLDSPDGGEGQNIDELKKALDEKTSETENLQKELEQQKAQFAELEKQKNEQIESLNKILEDQSNSASSSDSAVLNEQQQKIAELEAELESLKQALASADEELTQKANEMEKLTSEFQNLAEQQAQADAERNEEVKNVENTLSELKAANKKAEQEAEEAKRVCADISAQLEKIEDERDELKVELAALQTLAASEDDNAKKAEELEQATNEIEKLNGVIESKNAEIAKLQIELDEKSNEVFSSMSKSEEERFTNQIADQLIAIQGFQQNISDLQNELAKANNENTVLKAQLEAKSESENSPSLIPIEGESAIISSFIDFYDGLESVINKNPIPELVVLRQKLLDRLITPNEITHMEVISETFDPKKHIATTYFHSDKFPEECVVFEEEKGYSKGDAIVKKAKVWVVQNLYKCSNCGAMQSNYDDRFCPRCGTELKAPNGLPISSLPVYEPNAITYNKFAERMLEKHDLANAKKYIEAGLEIDSEYVPLLLRYADLLSDESNFEKALEIYNKANAIKPDSQTSEKIKSIETKLNIYNQLKALNVNSDLIEEMMSKILQK